MGPAKVNHVYCRSVRESVLLAISLAGMIVLGYVTAVYARDLVWLLAPGIVIAGAAFALARILR